MAQHIRNAAIELNNNGVQLLKAGDLNAAIYTVAKGLDMMKTIMENPQNVETHSSTDEDDENMLNEDDLKLAFMETSCDNHGMCHQQPSYVFCSPIEIPADATGLLPLKVSLLMVFNLALAHHLNGIKTSDCDQLEKALRLYECVYRISHEENVDLSVLHAMALTNNLGHIHLILQDTQKSQKCFEQLLATLIYFVEVSENNSDEIENLKGFFSNATGLSMTKCTAPAA
mmetsp:Transcript_8730/g.15897  ORF Transcript_8730/g.15897 Transcript_8730/m.15897 type:complete len:229 (+) Transcript_8730:148-834(+)